jgi:small basic protein
VIPVIGLLLGLLLGVVLDVQVPPGLQPYLPIAVVAALDALLGALRATLQGVFDDRVFVVSFVSNVLLAMLIVFVGDLLGVGAQLTTAVIVVLGIRIFTNAASIRRLLLGA